MSKKLFSIIVPVYNTDKYINKCLNSIQKAIDTDCEVIIINDGSTDNSEKTIKDYLKKLPEEYKSNYIYIKKENKGLADTKNVGIEKATGEFISVVDSDDYISDDFYSIARKYVNDFDIIIYDLYVIYENNNKNNYTSRAYKDYIENPLVSYLHGAMSGSSCNKIIKKELYNGHKFPVGKQYEDVAVTPFILCEADKIKYVPYPMYYYLQREKSIVATNTFATAFYKICNNITDVLKDLEIEKYESVINEFFVDRVIDNLSQDLVESNKTFIDNIKDFCEYNERIIKYITDNKLMYKYESDYSDEQKRTCESIFDALKRKDTKEVKKIFDNKSIFNRIKRKIRR